MDIVDTGQVRSVSWTLSGTLYARRGQIQGVVEQGGCWNPQEQKYETIPGQGADGARLHAQLPGAIWLWIWPSLSHGAVDDVDEFLDWPECQEHWNDMDYVVHDNKLSWNYEIRCGADPLADPVASGSVDMELPDWPALQHPIDGVGFYAFGNLAFEKSCPFSITVSAKLELKAGLELTECLGSYPNEIWQCHTIDKDTCWLTGRRVFYAEVLDKSDSSAAHLRCVINGEIVVDKDLALGDYNDEETWKSFFTNTDQVDAYVYATLIDDTRHTVGGASASLAVTRTGNTSSDYGEHHWAWNNWELDTDGGTVSAAIPAMQDLSTGITIVIALIDRCGPYTVSYGGRVTYVDGEPLIADCDIESNECVIGGDPPDGTCEDYINWTDGDHPLIRYSGWWFLSASYLPPYEHRDVKAFQLTGYDYPFNTGWFRGHGPITVSNGSLDELGEPRRNIGQYDAYADRRIPLSIGQTWAGWDAIKVSTETSHRVVACGEDETDDWTITHGWCSIQSDSGGAYLQIVISSDGGTAQRDYTDGENMQGARFCEIELDGPDGEIQAEISGRQWTISPGDSTIDLLCPHAEDDGADTSTQSLLPLLKPDDPEAAESDCSWGWGVYRIGTFKLTGLREGVYKLRGFTLKRMPVQDGGNVRIIAEPQAAWAEGRQSDSLTMPVTGDETYRQRVGLILIDGVVAGELVQIRYSYDPRAGWDIEEETLDEAGWRCFPEPDNGFFMVSDAAEGAKVPESWRHVGQVWCDVNDYNNVTAHARLMTDELIMPISGGPCNWLTIRKRFRGRTIIRVVDATRHYVKRKIRVYGGEDAHEVDETLMTNEVGVALSPAITQLDECHVEVLDSDPAITGSVTVRNRYLGLITLKAALAEEPVVGEDTDIYIDQLTGEGMLAYTTADGNLCCQRTYDAGATYTDSVTLTNTVSPQRPCVILRPDWMWAWGIMWSEGTDARLAWSVDGFKSFDVGTIMTGVSNVRAAVHPMTSVMLVAGWSEDSGGIVAARSYDYGETLSTPVLVAEAPEQAFGLTFAPTGLQTWCITCRNEQGDVRTYWSNDDGITWMLAE